MTTAPYRVERWPGDKSPAKSAIRRRMEETGLSSYRWSNNPGDVYAAHTHNYDKVIYVLRGSITFRLPDLGEEANLRAGDRLDLPAGTSHEAIVGPAGVTCLEAHH